MAEYALVDYDHEWPRRFEEIEVALESVLRDAGATVEHVGSTSVPGLAAKPIVDVVVVVPRPEDVDAALARLTERGYAAKGDRGVPGRLALTPPSDLPLHHPYLVVHGSDAYFDHIDLRDFLRAHPEEADAYAQEKRKHAHLLRANRRADYTDAKSDFVRALVDKARDHFGHQSSTDDVSDGVTYRWRCPVRFEEVDVLVGLAFGDTPARGWWRRVRPRSLGWVTAHDDATLVGFVNVITDGGLHVFILDTAVAPTHRRRGIGTGLVRRAAIRAREADCEWLHVDFETALSDFYLGSCGFSPTSAGLIRLR